MAFEGMKLSRIELPEVSLRVRHGGSGPPVLLLHGYPETHMMWAKVAEGLAREFTVVAPDLRGYGGSSRPPASDDHETSSSKRAMAPDVRGQALDCGHFLPEEKPAETLELPRGFFAEGR